MRSATRFAASGADVAIVARGREALDEAVKAIRRERQGPRRRRAGRRRQAADIQRAYDEAMKAFGKVDIVVNNAGTSRNGPFEKLTDEILQEDLEQKLFAAIRLIAAGLAADEGAPLGPHHQRAQHRRQGAARRQRADLGLARRRHGADQGARARIRAAQHPGQRHAGRVHRGRSARAGGEAGRTSRSTEYIAARAKEIPLGRIGKAEEFANMACFLVSDAGSYITGTATNVDGGRSPVV